MKLTKRDFGKIEGELAEILTPLDDISTWEIDQQLDYLKTAMIDAQKSAKIILDILEGLMLSDVIYGSKFWVIVRSAEKGIFAFSVFDLKGNPVYTTTNGSQKELEKYLDIEQIRKYI